MKQILYILLFVPFSLSAQLTTELADKLSEEINLAVQENEIQGISAAVILPNGDLWQDAAGFAQSNVPLTSNHHIFAGSTTKTFIAALIMQLQEENLLSIDEPIKNFIGPYNNIDEDITIKQLLNHTSGIYNYTDNPEVIVQLNANPSYEYQPNEILELVLAPEFEKGSNWAYSNTNYILLGLIIEAASNENLQTNLRTRCFEKLNLETAFLAGVENPIGPYAGLWLDQDGDDVLDDLSVFPTEALTTGAWGAGAIASTPRDLAKWVKTLYGSTDIVSDESMIEMKKGSSFNNSYGLGTSSFDYNGCEMRGHGGSIIHRTEMYYIENDDFSIVLMVNGGDYDFVALVKMVDHIKEALLTSSGEEIVLEPSNINFYPNPFTQELNVNFSLENAAFVKLEFYDQSGKKLKTLIKEHLPEGKHEYTWNGTFFSKSNLPSGMYSYQFYVNEELVSGSLVKM